MLLYFILSLIGMIVAAAISVRLRFPKPAKAKRVEIYLAAALGVLIGAKIPVWISYGFNRDLILSGKSYLGGILGAFLALNIYKFVTHQRDQALGGRFAIPLAVAAGFGKIGCYFNGCCGGRAFVPVQLIESAFQFGIAGLLYLFYRRTRRIDLLFPIYLASYLAMRFGIEFVRTEPRMLMNLTIYQWLAVVFLPYAMHIVYERKMRHA